MRWNTICFDLDNTLFSHEQAFQKAIHFCYQKMIQEWKEKERDFPQVEPSEWFAVFKKSSDYYWRLFEEKQVNAKTYRRLRYHDTMEAFSLPYSDHEADTFHDLYYEVVDQFSEPFLGLYSLIDMLVRAEVKVGIITNGTVDTQYRKLEKLGIDQLIPKKHVIISEEVGLVKPNPDIFALAKQRLQVDEKGCLFVGDSWEHDVVGALKAGWDAIYLNTRSKHASTDDRPFTSCDTLEKVAKVICDENRLRG